MFVFEPGAGCSGNATLVRPGDEFIFNNSSKYNRSSEELTEMGLSNEASASAPVSSMPRGLKFVSKTESR